MQHVTELSDEAVQVVDFSLKAISKAREIYERGSLAEYDYIETLAKYHESLCVRLRVASNDPLSQSTHEAFNDGGILTKIASECSETAADLIVELTSLRVQGSSPRIMKTIRASKRAMLKRDSIANKQKKLEQYQTILNTQILLTLRQNTDLALIQQNDGFGRLETGVQNLISGLAAGKIDVHALSDVIQKQTNTIHDSIHRGFMNQKLGNSVVEYQNRFLESLHFPEINARRETVAEAHRSTFQWVFQGDFNEWLESDGNIYWISGKAGSGKSTLMNYICEDQRTTNALQTWSKRERVLTPAFFFWNPGSEIQKSTIGLLRSLLYQLLVEYPHVILSLNTRSSVSETVPISDRFISNEFHPIAAWTEKQLQATIIRILRQELLPCRVCFFIDGLDEFKGNYSIAVSLIQDIVENTYVKVCVSSRPYRTFRDTFSDAPNLKLEDLTESDIRQYVTDRLSKETGVRKKIVYDPIDLYDLIGIVAKKACGVFLWVRLAIDDQMEGILDGDSLVQLKERLEILPSEMEELYMHMLEKIGKANRKEVVELFRLVLDARKIDAWDAFAVTQPSLLKLALARYKKLDDFLQFSPSIRGVDIKDHCNLTAHRMTSICGGLLEIQRAPSASSPRSTNSSNSQAHFKRGSKSNIEDATASTQALSYNERHQIHFLHRTTVDFFRENAQAHEFLSANSTADFDPYRLHVKAELAMMILFTRSERGLKLYAKEHGNVGKVMYDDPTDFKEYVRSIMLSAHLLDCHTTVAQIPLMENIDDTISQLYRRYNRGSPLLNWYSRWGGLPVLLLEEHDSCKYIGDLQNEKIEKSWFLNQYLPNHEICQPSASTHSGTFLSLAADWGLYNYVLQSLQSHRYDLNVPTATYLLSYAHNTGLHERLAQQANLVIFLLAQGACPNETFHNVTQWNKLLQDILHRYEHMRPNHEILIRMLMAYLENDANVLETINIQCKCKRLTAEKYERIRRAVAPRKLPHFGAAGPMEIRFSIRHSPLAIFHHYLRSGHSYGMLHEMAVAKGARSKSELLRIRFQYHQQYAKCELSNLQLDKINRAFDESFGQGWILPTFESCKDSEMNTVLTCLVRALSEENNVQGTKSRDAYGDGDIDMNDDNDSDEDNGNGEDKGNDEEEDDDDDDNDSMHCSLWSSSENEDEST